MTPIVAGLWGVMGALSVGSLLAHTRLARRLLDRDPERWEHEGCPVWFLPPPRRGEIPGGATFARILETQ